MTTAIDTTTTTTPATPSITLPAPRKKKRVREVLGAAVPVPSALPKPPCTHYEATYSQGHITVHDPRQAAALWHNGYYGHGFVREGGSGDRGRDRGGGIGGQKGKKKWMLVEADGLRDARWFKERREEQRRKRRDFKGGGAEGGEEMEEEEREVKRREGEMAMNWVEEEEEMEEEEREEKRKSITEFKSEDEMKREKMEQRKNMIKEEVEDTEQRERSTKQEDKEGNKNRQTGDRAKSITEQEYEEENNINTTEKGENHRKHDIKQENKTENTNPTLLKPPKQSRNHTVTQHSEPKTLEGMNDYEDNLEPWRTILTLSADQESNPDHSDPSAYISLLPEEALFLSYALGCLVLTFEDPPTPRERRRGKRVLYEQPDSHEMTIDEMWHVFVRDDPMFPVKYAAFHHFRTQGWVVKAGLKYGVDYVLYPVGPPFYHSQYSVRVHSLWADSLTLDQSLPGHEMTWTTVAATERLANHINKTPVMCFVLRPRATTDQRLALIDCLKELKVQTVVLGRWSPSDGSG